MRETDEELKEKIKDKITPFKRKLISAIIGTVVTSIIGVFGAKEVIPKSPLEEASEYMESDQFAEDMDKWQNIPILNEEAPHSVVGIFPNTKSGTDNMNSSEYADATGVIVDISNDEIVIATSLSCIPGDRVCVQIAEQSDISAVVRNIDSNTDVAIIIVNTEDLQAETLGLIKAVTPVSEEVKRKMTVYGTTFRSSGTVGIVLKDITDADCEQTLEDGQTMSLVEIGRKDAQSETNKIYYTENKEVLGISFTGEIDNTEEGCDYILPIEIVLQIAGLDTN